MNAMTFCGWRLLIDAVWLCVVWHVGLAECREQYQRLPIDFALYGMNYDESDQKTIVK